MDDPLAGLTVGYDIPARPGMSEAEVATPCLLVDLDAFERNLMAMRDYAAAKGVALRVHGKMHKTPAVALRQMDIGGAIGVCCQKVAEAEAFLRGGVTNILVSNQIRDPARIDRLAQLAGQGHLSVCIDDIANVAELSQAVVRHGTSLDVLVEIDCGQGRCGVPPGAPVLTLAQAVAAAGLRFAGLQIYHGNAQHVADPDTRAAILSGVVDMARDTMTLLADHDLACETVTGAGTGSFPVEAASGVYTELQCGSYAFMDVAYGATPPLEDAPRFDHALFVAAQVMSTAGTGIAVLDAGHKAAAIDSGPPVVWGDPEAEVQSISDEHCVIADPEGRYRVGDRLRLVPGHCDPTCNLHDWLVGVRGGVVEVLWPVTARGKGY
ncbi:DSD1 family PLP-dependent enzyme [Jannaschia sp. M317]|uniref:DSD1 family PLP-dependent enzyme n=1 Tax=Jannaschia sp. M317 TaxID=2867011 RepID=UPI0021A6CBAE|nr:DSD1 family PLP-dependent enzyme [Jannaschia sp. M317]UWQ18729.1 DSD1 family PLP-dependent enzyme [Jannaschia sp. M317]